MFKSFIQISLLLGILFPGLIIAQETVSELKRAISSVKKEIDQETKKISKEKARDAKYKNTTSTRYSRIQTQIQKVGSQKDSLAKELLRLKKSGRKLRGGAFWFQKKRQDYATFLAREADSLADYISKDFPVDLDKKVQALKGISSRLRSDNMQPEEAQDRIWSIILESMKSGYTIESWKGSLTQVAGDIPGEFLRVGRVFQIFVADQSEVIYLMSVQGERNNSKWTWSPHDFNLDERTKIRNALKVKTGKSAPQLVEIPIPYQIKAGGAP